MRTNYKMIISYDGTAYSGFASQKNTDLTIQGKLEAVLSRMMDEEVEVIGAGRTDAGVHAKGMCVNVHLNGNPEPKEVMDYLNRYLPMDISVLEATRASERFHSRYNATGKTYCYTCYVGNAKPVFNRKYVYALEKMPDIKAMQEASKHLLGTHDFLSFCGNPKFKKDSVRTIDKVDIRHKGDYLTITVHGDGFLQNMVRIITGTLLEVGFGEKSPEDMPKIIEAKDREAAGFIAHAKGLCLMSVDYQ